MRRNILLELTCSKALRKSYPDEWRAWRAAWSRTTYKSSKDYHLYGGKGIRVDLRWQDFENFLLDMKEKPEPKKSFDLVRRDKSKNYCLANCHWGTESET